MNERIRQLAEQAFNEANNGSINNIKIPKEFVEKFAELIVRECVLISRTSTDGFSAGKRMAEHFGVAD